MVKADLRYTVITGASSGIGYATAIAFAKRNKPLIIIARRQEQLILLKQIIADINPELDVIIKKCDLSLSKNVHSLFTDLEQYFIETWINNAGFGHYGSIGEQDLNKIESMLHLNIEALTILSTLYVRKYHDQAGTQLINISSRGGYTIVPNAVTYCATKFYVNAFTEGLAQELIKAKTQLRAKVLAPAATQTEFGQKANNVDQYDYDKSFAKYHSADQMAQFLLELYDSDKIIGEISTKDFTFSLKDCIFPYSGNPSENQKN
ncbi:SDR family NAD(P)-dependent oxidoreductase [Gilliamella sp. B2776]|uniref:SDR family NAD(P)-dependent oxidoreductase n=1 Tax=unclassified Gilliamella TaxID=2685620 RepID=UPI00226A98E1|nr:MULTISPECIES: SDR family NAD(P)-dependent oxidoreductase [unclassified Gilliamella]MCX8649322.1 SDR family NAD(P)-dependent oxidoreductase [Gilliamella sp. B2779]MCX8655064.1 SDR family NAD(P)-dependent oxidoreductase [Gilliamella sp. B2737]MCX8655837.1 SDR family NAD(P)-dependent oxidoreductase [Gilliamella sp. B2894]MCX8691183.1 SDR family NAD(P)-dependent oxidoreductase [Gilliamella sp. B2776]MCX8694618.1 SDR family NAD(P)-dependent oxidoreductase [Gilliamella sp. B2881]